MVELQYCLGFARFDYSKDTESVLSPPFHETSKNLSLKVAPGSPSSVLLLPFSSGLLNHHITHWPPSTSIMVRHNWSAKGGRVEPRQLRGKHPPDGTSRPRDGEQGAGAGDAHVPRWRVQGDDGNSLPRRHLCLPAFLHSR